MKKLILLCTLICIGQMYGMSERAMEYFKSEELKILARRVNAGPNKNDLVMQTTQAAAQQGAQEVSAQHEQIIRAINAAQEGMKNKSVEIRDNALWLFTVLVSKGYGINEAIKAAQQGAMDKNIDIQARSMDLFSSLVKAGYAYGEAAKAARYVIDAYPNEPMENTMVLMGLGKTIHTYAMQVFMALAKKGQAIGDVTAIAQLAIEKGAVNGGMELFEALTKKGYAIAEATAAAQKIVDDYEEDEKSVDFFAFAKASTLLDDLGTGKK